MNPHGSTPNENGAEVSGPGAGILTLVVNGRTVQAMADPGTTLAEVLRDELGLTGTKIGCDRGACSACTVWLDGEVAASCMTLALDARGRQITTIEGLGARRRRSTRSSRRSSSTTPCSAASARRAW